ncbi:hypothetical protein TNCV_2351511 [Trichonephila clavipes]|nr:hypothetical protein TNCV_2351511 [Trichonephila clavipes]
MCFGRSFGRRRVASTRGFGYVRGAQSEENSLAQSSRDLRVNSGNVDETEVSSGILPEKALEHIEDSQRNITSCRNEVGTLGTKDEEVTAEMYKGIMVADSFRSEQECCAELALVWKHAKEGKGNYYEVDGYLFHRDKILGESIGQLVIPKCRRTEVLRLAHTSVFSSHMGPKKTLERIEYSFFWEGLRSDVKKVCESCKECQLTRSKVWNKQWDKTLSAIIFNSQCEHDQKRTHKFTYIFTVIDAFTKFTWLYPTKSTTAQEAIERLKLQQKTFGNPLRVINDKGGAFRSKEFEDYCADEQISNVQITTGVPRENGQVERIHGVLIPVLTKMSIEDPTKWFKYVDSLQRVLNSVPSRSTKYSPFELLIGVKMKNPEDVMIRNLFEEESQEQLFQHRDNLRREAKQNILKIQEENRRTYNQKRKEAHLYKKGDLVAVMRTQFGNKLKLRIKYFGPHQVTKVKPYDRYDVTKIGDQEGLNVTSASADQMKPWT